MVKTLSTLAVLALMLMIPAAALADDHAPAEKIVGKWEAKSISIGEETEQLPPGSIMVEFMANGTMKSTEAGGQEETGTYKIEGDKITFYEEGQQDGDEMNLTIDGDTMTIWQEEGGMKFSISFARKAG